jgi:hypothetical protein
VARACSEGVELTGDNGLLTALGRRVMQTGLEVEMTDHLGDQRHDPKGRGSANSRNGSYPKKVTTDIGKVDANGYLYVLDRGDDVIISGGFNIWPAELETVIADHPRVLEVAVFAVPDDRWARRP